MGLAQYIEAAESDNTRRSYASAIRHFEVEWKGLLPSTADAMARYLADHAATLAINTLRQRLAALSRWHTDQGFPDPTKSALVRQVLKGIRAVHSVPEKRARPLELTVLQQIDQWLDTAISNAQRSGDRPAVLRHTRDRSLMLLGFWRGFRSDELVNLRVENIEITTGQGMACYLGRSKGDRQLQGRVFKCPALTRLCPVTAFNTWISLAGLTGGPVFRKIDRWGHVAEGSLHVNSLIPLLRSLFAVSGVARLCRMGPRQRLGHQGADGVRRLEGCQIGHALPGCIELKSAGAFRAGTDCIGAASSVATATIAPGDFASGRCTPTRPRSNACGCPACHDDLGSVQQTLARPGPLPPADRADLL